MSVTSNYWSWKWKTVILPRNILDIALAVTDERIKAENVAAWKSFNRIISRAKKTPPSGVLNIAAIAAPDPAAVNIFLLWSENLKIVVILLATPPPNCAAGPSGPTVPPEPIQITGARKWKRVVLNGINPPLMLQI